MYGLTPIVLRNYWEKSLKITSPLAHSTSLIQEPHFSLLKTKYITPTLQLSS